MSPWMKRRRKMNGGIGTGRVPTKAGMNGGKRAKAGSKCTSRPTSRTGTNRPTGLPAGLAAATGLPAKLAAVVGWRTVLAFFLMACLFHSRLCVASLFLSCLPGNAAAHQHQWHAPAAAEARPEAARACKKICTCQACRKICTCQTWKIWQLPSLQLLLPDLKLPQQKLTGLNLSFFGKLF